MWPSAGCTSAAPAGKGLNGQQPLPGCHHCWKSQVAPVRRCRPSRRGVVLASAGDTPPLPGGDGPTSAIPDSLPVAGIDSDWRTFRAQLVASAANTSSSLSPTAGPAEATTTAATAVRTPGAAWAHSLPQPEQGCLLLANPLMFATSQTYFHMSVILVFAHDERGSAGLILNRPTEYKVGQLGQGANSLQPEFNPCQLLLGGDVGPDTVHLLHGIHGLPGSVEIIRGVQLGGFDAAKTGLAEGRFSPDQFKVLTRYAGWGPGQLEAECKRGVWLPVSASKHAILQQQAAKGAAPSDMWHFVAQLAGGDLAALSREVQGVTDPEIQRAAGGGYVPESPESDSEAEDAASGSGDMAGGGWAADDSQARWQQRRRGRLPEADYRDGAGI